MIPTLSLSLMHRITPHVCRRFNASSALTANHLSFSTDADSKFKLGKVVQKIIPIIKKIAPIAQVIFPGVAVIGKVAGVAALL